MQDVDRPADVQALSQPARAGRPRVEAEALRGVMRSETLNRISGYRGQRRDVRQGSSVRPLEMKRAVRLMRDLVTLFVDGAMVAATEQREVRERRRAALRPVPDVMTLADGHAAAREAAAMVPMIERSPQGGWNRPGPGPDLQEAPGFIVAHHHPAGIARQAPGRFL